MKAVSVIVPTYNRTDQLATCLEALAKQNHPDFEVIISDDGSENPPHEAVNSFAESLDLTLLVNPHKGPASARNAGARHARGNLLAFTDDDCIPHPGWLRALEARAKSSCGIGGRTVNALTENAFSMASQLLVSYLYAYYNADPDHALFLASNNAAFPADRFDEIGGFDEKMPFAAGEDRDLCDRWLNRGWRLLYAPDAVIYHAHALNLRAFWRQHFTYGQGAFQFHQQRAERGARGVQLEPIRFYTGLLRYPLKQHLTARMKIKVLVLLMLSQLANAAGYFEGRIRA